MNRSWSTKALLTPKMSAMTKCRDRMRGGISNSLAKKNDLNFGEACHLNAIHPLHRSVQRLSPLSLRLPLTGIAGMCDQLTTKLPFAWPSCCKMCCNPITEAFIVKCTVTMTNKSEPSMQSPQHGDDRLLVRCFWLQQRISTPTSL